MSEYIVSGRAGLWILGEGEGKKEMMDHKKKKKEKEKEKEEIDTCIVRIAAHAHAHTHTHTQLPNHSDGSRALRLGSECCESEQGRRRRKGETMDGWMDGWMDEEIHGFRIWWGL